MRKPTYLSDDEFNAIVKIELDEAQANLTRAENAQRRRALDAEREALINANKVDFDLHQRKEAKKLDSHERDKHLPHGI